MRLNRLDLVRYGKFTDKRIDLGARPQDKPDLHIIYGPNEAGKSTALAAFLDLLFGIDPRSHFNFMHPYATMRIGAILDLAGEAKEFLRVKRPHNSLLDAGEQPISEAAILGELGGIDREVLSQHVFARRRNSGGWRRGHSRQQGRPRPAPLLRERRPRRSEP